MKRYLVLVIVFATVPVPALWSDEHVSKDLVEASLAEQSNHPSQAIHSIQTLLASNSLTGSDLVVAWNILGLSFADLEDFDHARAAYEKALSLYPLSSQDAHYADVLSNFANLYNQMGQFDAASHLRLRALPIYRASGDHSAIARSYANLAGIELSQGHRKQAKRYLDAANTELATAHDIDPEDEASLLAAQGWERELEDDSYTALADYQQALKLWQGRYGENSGTTGWGHVLVGKVYAGMGNYKQAAEEMSVGIATLKAVLGDQNLRYLTSQLAYSQVLAHEGFKAQAAALQDTTKQAIQTLRSRECNACSISIQALR